MSTHLKLELFSGEGTIPLTILESGEVTVGREPPVGGVTIDNGAISRSHATFSKIKNHWFFRDLGSTNGSWINGKQIKEGALSLVRLGDIIQLADVAIRVGSQSDKADSGYNNQFIGSTLIVFSNDVFLDEFPLPEYGRALVLGGSQPDIAIEGYVAETPRLIIERRGDLVVATPSTEGPDITINGAVISTPKYLNDCDEVVVSTFKVLFNDPRSKMRTSAIASVKPSAVASGSSTSLRAPSSRLTSSDWGFDAGSPSRGSDEYRRPMSSKGIFGKRFDDDEDEVAGTMAMDPSELEAKLQRYDMHPSSRFGNQDYRPGFSLNSLEDKLIVFVGFGALILVVLLVIWWVFVSI